LELYPIQLRSFRNKYPDEKIIAYAGSKGIRLNSEEEVKREINWALSRRSLFILSEKRILMGSWNININDI